MRSTTEKQFFPAITGYRAIAAWMIFVYHFMPFSNPKYPQWIKQIVWEFHIGVDMFFVLSGFLITYRYFNDYPIHFKKYMVNRVARIYPMYFLITAAVFIVWFFQNGDWNLEKTIEAVLSFTMTKALCAKYFLAGIPQGWTLTLEELFYFTAPFYFILIRKNRAFLYILPIIIFIFGAGMKYIFNTPENEIGFLQTNIYTYIIEFFAGITLGLILLKRKIIFQYRWITWFGMAIILYYLLGKPFFPQIGHNKSDITRFLDMFFLSFLGIVPLLWGLINEDTWIRRILGNKWMVLLGKSSYIFYLIHKGFVPVFINDYMSDNKLVIFVLLNIISVILFRFLEEPLNHFIRRKFGKPSKK